ncbi:hypothetical protein [Mucilaginibacter sp. KACC 22063]|uniref:hypothetical protein n=1 Tax=Mucilaginibacter sp. KACC 22063 TaxID=3025666 RepID=UPI002366070A|nr:hypothetical protein [Mucilaginibacter sp. KACC 22063]WDF55242.1 hypothetical protein PQ461_20120 [Mucilaginibacter sp. KACC 22063]
MVDEITELVERLSNPNLAELDVITWGAPVPTFGNLEGAKIATLGLNPSNKEFVDNSGNELIGNARRFHTLSSLGLEAWEDVQPCHLNSIVELCNEYFLRNPYDGWFKRLDYLISGTSLSYYFPSSGACHLDLIPYATTTKWGELTNWQRNTLLKEYGDILGELLRKSSIRLLVLNGKSVLDNFNKISDVNYEITLMEDWCLPRKDSTGVPGFSYEGICRNIGGVSLDEPLCVLGFNHNIQSSYGITTAIQESIRKWIATKSASFL